MKQFKKTDYWLSVLLIISFLIMSLVNQDSTFIVGYCVVGGWQVISMIVHAWYNWFNEKGSSRRVYHWITFISVVTMPIGSIFILLFVAPFMACYYCWICYEEVYVKMKRPLSFLK